METTGERQEYSPVVRGIRKCVGTWVHSTFRSLGLVITEGKEVAKEKSNAAENASHYIWFKRKDDSCF